MVFCEHFALLRGELSDQASVSVLCVAVVFLFSEEPKCCLWKHCRFFHLNAYLLFYLNRHLSSCSGINIREEIICKKSMHFLIGIQWERCLYCV